MKDKYYFNYSDEESVLFKAPTGLRCVKCDSDKIEPNSMMLFFRLSAAVDIVCSDCNSEFKLLLNDENFEFVPK